MAHGAGLASDQRDTPSPVRERHTRARLPAVSTLPEASTHTTDSHRGVRARACACAHVCGHPCARTRAFLCTCHFQITLSSSLSSKKKKGAMFLLDCGDLSWGFLPTPPALPTWLHVRSSLLSQGPACGPPAKGPGKMVALSFLDHKLLFLFNP